VSDTAAWVDVLSTTDLPVAASTRAALLEGA
jgi:hypothetical protein